MKIRHISTAFPESILTNDDLSALYPAWSADKIYEKTGIRQRHIATDDETALDLAEKAACTLFSEAAVEPSSIDFILFCTQTPDYAIPTSACILQARLDLPTTVGALDFNLGCSGYIYGLCLAKGLIKRHGAKKVLLITSETYSKRIHPMDKSTRTIFGDGAAATLVEKSDDASLGEFVLGTNGKGANAIMVPVSGARMQRSTDSSAETTDSSGNVRTDEHLQMNGPDVFNFTLQVVPPMIQAVLTKNSLSKDDIDLFVFHQANQFMLDVLRKTVRIPREKFYVNMEDIGNTVSASIPIALTRAVADGSLKPGMKVLLCGFGVGLSWGAVVINWASGKC